MTRHPSRIAPSSLACALAAALLLLAAPAGAEVEIGGFTGLHLFNPDNELGRADDGGPDSAPQHMALLGFRLSYLPIPYIGFEGEVAFIPTFTRGATNPFTPMLAYRGNLVVNFLKGKVRPFALVGGGAFSMFSTDKKVVDTDTDPAIHAGLGVRVDIRPNWGFRADARILFPPAIGGPSVTVDGEILLGLYGRFAMDKASAAPAKNPDEDGDSVIGDSDACPKEPEDRDGFQDSDGCPDPDNDKDGILDGDDRCPIEAGIPENQGCPDKDTDGDGLIDRSDKCPQVAGPINLEGCPDVDSDGDGLNDRLDKCPKEPETRNYFQDEDGCPDELPQSLQKFTGVIQGIQFELNRSAIMASSFMLLDDAVKVLNDYPDVRMEISGHSDSSGDAVYNKELSQKRANAVRAYFIKKGIAESRLTALGFGQERPLAPNDSVANRKKNRRVEFQLIQ